jgi:hypothetical protein
MAKVIKQGFIIHKQKVEKWKLIVWLGEEYVCTIWFKYIIYVIGTNRRTWQFIEQFSSFNCFFFPTLLNKFLHFFSKGYKKRSETHFSSINLFLINMNVISYDGKIEFYNFRKEFIGQIFYYAKYVNLFITYKYYKTQFSIKCVCIQQNGRNIFLGIRSSVWKLNSLNLCTHDKKHQRCKGSNWITCVKKR